MKRRGPFRIGDQVINAEIHRRVQRNEDFRDWDGTVVDVIEDTIVEGASLYRVYWRYPLGKVSDYRAPELLRVS